MLIYITEIYVIEMVAPKPSGKEYGSMVVGQIDGNWGLTNIFYNSDFLKNSLSTSPFYKLHHEISQLQK